MAEPSWSLPPDTSASQLTSFGMCPRKFMFRYVLGLEPEFRSMALLLGSTVGSAIGWWFEERIVRREPTLDEALQVFEADFEAETHGTPVRWKDTAPDELIQRGRGLVNLYLVEQGALPVIEVEARFRFDVEDPATGEVLSRALKGYFDLVLEDGTVVELKTSSRQWSEWDLERHIQVGAYVAAGHVRSGGNPSRLGVHVLVKTKTPRLQVLTIERTEGENRWWLTAAVDLERAIAGHYPPSPGPLCVECEHRRTCRNWVGIMSTHRPLRSLPMARGEHPSAALSI